jgi:hypothetical protein
MIKEELSLTDKSILAIDLGFNGVKLNSPVDFPMSEIINAKAKSGIELPSVVNKDHWNSPLSDLNPEIRKKMHRVGCKVSAGSKRARRRYDFGRPRSSKRKNAL